MSWTSCHVPHAPPPHSRSTSNGLRGISPPSPMLLAGSGQLSANSREFIPRSRIVAKNAEGLEVDLRAIAASGPISVAGASLDSSLGLRQGNLSPAATPIQRPLSIRMETEEQRRKRLADQGKLKAEEEEKARQKTKKKEEQQKRKDEKQKRKEGEQKRKEEEQKRKEEEQKMKEEEQKRKEVCKAREEQETSRIITSPLPNFQIWPGPLDHSDTKKASPSPPSARAAARAIEDLGSVPYPEGISSPKTELNINAKNGKFRYDREFLLQFKPICKEKPDMLTPLDALGLGPTDLPSLSMSSGRSGRSGRHRQRSGDVPSHQASVGLGLGGFGKPGPSSLTTPSKLSGDEPSGLSISGREALVNSISVPFVLPSPMQKTVNQGGTGDVPVSSRTTNRHEGERNENNHVESVHQSHGFSHGQSNMGQSGSLEPVAPLQATANRRDASALDPVSPEIVHCKVKDLLNKLTIKKFDSISDEIIALVNNSEENNGKTLIQITQLIYERVTDDVEIYALLCRKIMEQISPSVQDRDSRNTEGKPLAGGQLFRKCLLNRCHDDFERGWMKKEETPAAAATKALENQVAAKTANDMIEDGDSGEIVRYSNEITAAQKAKRWQGLIKFCGELFKFQMLTERIMHGCVKKLLGNAETPEEEEIEGLCILFTSVGAILDIPKARAHMNVYFSRMKELTKSYRVSSRMQFMLQDIIELRERKWVPRNSGMRIAQIYKAAAGETVASSWIKQSYPGGVLVSSRTTSRHEGERNDSNQVENIHQSHGFSYGQSNMGQSVSLEPVAPLQATANRREASAVDPVSPKIVNRKVKGLLSKLTIKEFDSISDEIIALVNNSEENNGKILIQITQLIYERVTDDAEMYALLCRKIMEQISPSVQDHDMRDVEGKPMSGSQLFRKYLLNRCQDDFERGWMEKEEIVAAAATKTLENQVAAKTANCDMIEDGDSKEIIRSLDKITAVQKAKRWHDPGKLKFYGELFKFQMLTERTMHECVKKLLGNAETPEEEEIEGLCILFTSVGAILDTPKARAHMDVYFFRMKELAKSYRVSSRMQSMLQDVIELRERKWVPRNSVVTIAQIHAAAAKEKAAWKNQSSQRQLSTSRSGFLRGGDRGDYASIDPDGWSVAGDGLPKAGDLSKLSQVL